MADIDSLQLPDGSQFDLVDNKSDYATKGYVQDQIGTINKTTIGLGNVDNTSDANKPVSTAQQSALNEKLYSDVIADEESEFTASRRYEEGEQFIYQGALYKTTTIVPNGDPFEVGVNVELSDDILTQIGEKQDTLELDGETVTGNPLSFNTDSEQVGQNAVITFEPVQDGAGDASPNNIRKIRGFNVATVGNPSKNLFDKTMLLPTGLISNDGSVTANETYRYTEQYISVEPATEYTTSGSLVTTSSTYNTIAFYDAEKNFISRSVPTIAGTGWTFTTPSNCYYIRMMLSQPNIDNIQIEKGSSATAYEPYNYLVHESLPETLYGFTWHVEDGELVVTHKKRIVTSSYSIYMEYGKFYINERECKRLNDYRDEILCDKMVTVQNQSESVSTTPWISGYSSTANLGNNWIYFNNSNCSTVQEFKDWLDSVGGVEFTYPLADPITIQLPAHSVKLLSGANVVTTNGTSMSLTYRNGEVAKLSDLSGLADSVNGLGDIVGEFKTEMVTVYKTTNASKTWEAKLNELEPYYSQLTTEQKNRSFIVNNTTGIVLRYSADKKYSASYMESVSEHRNYDMIIDASASKFARFSLTTSGVSVENYTSISTTSVIELCYLKVKS